MTALNPPDYIQVGSHGADTFRRALKALRSQGGVVSTGDLAVAQNGTPNMSVNVAAGQAIIDGTENAVTQGSYIVTNDATVNLAVAASDPTNPRNDLVVAKVQDAFYSGATSAWSLVVITGTPAGSPVDPATPANSITLARVRVDALATTIVNAKITDLRADSDGAIFPGSAGWTLWDSTGALKNASVTDGGLWTFRNGLLVPAAAAGALAPNSAYATMPIKIDDQLLAAPATTVTFINPLPTNFRHLLIEWYARGDNASVNTGVQLRFNNISTATYDSLQVFNSTASAVAAAEVLASTSAQIGTIPANTATANYFGVGQARVIHYQGAVGNKMVISDVAEATDNVTTNILRHSFTAKWRTTATPITRIDLIAAAGNFVVGSLFTLWGLP